MKKYNGMKRAVAAGMAVLLSQTVVWNSGQTVFAETEKISASAEKTAAEEKEESVYATANANGTVESVIVSNWLKNPDMETEIEDRSSLSDITNVKGEETYTQEGEKLIWQANGNEIYYQGKSNQELPVRVSITYYLDGKEIAPEELAGKSGKLKMHIEYESDARYQNVEVPFLMMTGMILPDDTFTNVTVDNGHVIADGDRQIVVGMGFPGLYKSLELEKKEGLEDIEIPESFDVTADVENFSLQMTMTVATAGDLSDFGLDDVDGIDDLKEALDELKDATEELVDGSGELADGVETLKDSCEELAEGMATLNDKTGELNDGVQTLNNKKGDLISGLNTLSGGIESLRTGAGTLGTGISAYTKGVGTLESGVDAYVDGADTLSNGIKAYVTGAEQLENGVLELSPNLKTLSEGIESANAGAQQLGNKENAEALKKGASDVADGIGQLQAALQVLSDPEMQQALQSAAALTEDESILNAVQTLNNLDLSGISQAAGGLEASTAALSTAASELSEINSAVNAALGNETVQKGLEMTGMQGQVAAYQGKLTDAMGQIEASRSYQEAVKQGLPSGETIQAVENVKALGSGQTLAVLSKLGNLDISGLPQLETSISELKEGADAVSENVDTVMDGNVSLAEGMNELAAGASLLPEAADSLEQGAKQLKANNKELISGANSLISAGDKLQSGADELNSKSGELNRGAAQLKDGADQLSSGSSQLVSGAGTLSSGIGELADGSSQLKDGTQELADAGGELTDGVDELYDGAAELAEGMEEFQTEGIDELYDVVNEDLQKVLDRLDEVKDAGISYQTFTGKEENIKGSVKFVITTAEIDSEE
ncbi:MAG: hypothetical protein Q4C91_22350 [Eubacteriales bacterium]|nr:hypothetical protein [Eubacteriales bacterium]